jgi:mRNA interferase MazF
MARGDVLLVGLPESDKREEKGNRPAVAVQTDVVTSPMLMIVPATSSLPQGAVNWSSLLSGSG